MPVAGEPGNNGKSLQITETRALRGRDEIMSVTRADIVAEARAWIGTPYRHQASLKGVGCDCLGLVRGVWRAVIGDEPERAPAYSRDWAEASGERNAGARRRARI